ncbi:MAG TPA: VIT1/CCC1 transporter family protein [Candidatus Nanoarchaeia archaeon]|nr:VIT1/CCC1 transporter family protein [Candidatus Nanoarchaeia archaeon]
MKSGDDIGSLLRDIILGGQDGVVNVLGLVLGVAAATADPRIILIAGLAGGFAESISMAAVAYTSTKAARDFARSRHRLSSDSPKYAAVIVGGSSLIGSFLPLFPFLFLAPMMASVVAVILCGIVLFATGFVKGKLTKSSAWKSGVELLVIGLLAAFAGYLIGHWLGVILI